MNAAFETGFEDAFSTTASQNLSLQMKDKGIKEGKKDG